jgi:hypothetical protein
VRALVLGSLCLGLIGGATSAVSLPSHLPHSHGAPTLSAEHLKQSSGVFEKTQ